MSLEVWLAFVAASVVMLIIPGPTILAVISYAIAQGRSASLPLVAAVALGDSTALFASLVGLGALLATSAFWFTVVKVVGGAYLLYLGGRMLLAGARTAPIATDAAAVPASSGRLFFNTWLVTALNPKGIVFFVAFLPQFITPGADATAQLWILAVTFVVLATLNATGYVLFAAGARNLLRSPGARRGFNLAGGSLLSLAGVWALLARRLA